MLRAVIGTVAVLAGVGVLEHAGEAGGGRSGLCPTPTGDITIGSPQVAPSANADAEDYGPSKGPRPPRRAAWRCPAD